MLQLRQIALQICPDLLRLGDVQVGEDVADVPHTRVVVMAVAVLMAVLMPMGVLMLVVVVMPVDMVVGVTAGTWWRWRGSPTPTPRLSIQGITFPLSTKLNTFAGEPFLDHSAETKMFASITASISIIPPAGR